MLRVRLHKSRLCKTTRILRLNIYQSTSGRINSTTEKCETFPSVLCEYLNSGCNGCPKGVLGHSWEVQVRFQLFSLKTFGLADHSQSSSYTKSTFFFFHFQNKTFIHWKGNTSFNMAVRFLTICFAQKEARWSAYAETAEAHFRQNIWNPGDLIHFISKWLEKYMSNCRHLGKRVEGVIFSTTFQPSGMNLFFFCLKCPISNTSSESVSALGWVVVAPTPAPYIKEMNDAGQFYTNR